LEMKLNTSLGMPGSIRGKTGDSPLKRNYLPFLRAQEVLAIFQFMPGWRTIEFMGLF